MNSALCEKGWWIRKRTVVRFVLVYKMWMKMRCGLVSGPYSCLILRSGTKVALRKGEFYCWVCHRTTLRNLHNDFASEFLPLWNKISCPEAMVAASWLPFEKHTALLMGPVREGLLSQSPHSPHCMLGPFCWWHGWHGAGIESALCWAHAKCP